MVATVWNSLTGAQPICLLCGAPVAERNVWVPTASYDVSAQRVQRRIGRCESCGYERNLDVWSVADAIRMQSHFDSQAPVLDVRQARWPSRAALVAAKINRLAPKRGRALDIGCNTGVNLKALGPGWERVGVELSAPLAQVARHQVPAQVHIRPVEEVDEPPASFDLVTCYAVIEHLFDPAAFVDRVHALLRPGGLLVLMTGDCESRLARQMGDGWPLRVSPDHVSFFSARSLRRLVDEKGFDLLSEEWRFMYFADGVGSRSRRLAMRLREIAGLSVPEEFDTYYLYARKRLSG